MSMMISSGYQNSFVNDARKELKEIENRGVSKAETLEDIRDTKGKSYRTADLVKLMEKYDPEAYAEFSKNAKTVDGAYTQSGLSYLSGWLDKVKKGFKDGTIDGSEQSSPISKKNEENLSKKAQDFLANLRKQYGDYDFFVGNGSDDLKALSKSGSKEYSVIFSSAEIERMANDEKYAKEKMDGVAGAVKMAKKVAEEYGFPSALDGKDGPNGTLNKITVSIDDNGNMKLFAELEKSSEKQRERIEKAREKRADEKKEAEKKDKTRHQRNPYMKNDKDTVKRTTVEADSMEELMQKIKDVDWNKVKDSRSGDRFDFMA